jgi:hypothetical protein
MRPDPPIDDIRRTRRIISAEYGNDPRRMLEYFAELQARLKHRLVSYGTPATADVTDSPPGPAGRCSQCPQG